MGLVIHVFVVRFSYQIMIADRHFVESYVNKYAGSLRTWASLHAQLRLLRYQSRRAPAYVNKQNDIIDDRYSPE